MLPKVKIKRKEENKNYKISNFVPAVMEKYLKTKPKEYLEISDIYRKLFGEEISSVSSILKYEKGILTIKVKNPVWKNELQFREEEMKNIINLQKYHNLQVNKIIFK